MQAKLAASPAVSHVRVVAALAVLGCAPQPPHTLVPLAETTVPEPDEQPPVRSPPTRPPQLKWRSWTFDHVSAVGLAVGDGAVWLATLDNRLLLSIDGARNFSEVEMSLDELMDDYYRETDSGEVRLMFAKGRDLYVTTTYQVFVARDLGSRWEHLASPTLEMAGGEAPSPIEGLWADADTVYFLESVGKLQFSTDDGKTWREDAEARAACAECVSAFYGMTGNDAGYRYIWFADGRGIGTGGTGRPWSALATSDLEFIHLAAGWNTTLFGIRRESRVGYRSTDGGQRWASLEISGVRAFAAGGRKDWSAATDHGLFHSLDNGRTWRQTTVTSLSGDTRDVRWHSLWQNPEHGYALGNVGQEHSDHYDYRGPSIVAHGVRE